MTNNAKVAGMKIKDIDILADMLNRPEVEKNWESVAEYIERTGCKTERRISKKGVELVKVFFETGAVKEYEAAHLDTTTAFA